MRDQTTVTRDIPVTSEDRKRVAELMSQPQSTERDNAVESTLGKYFEMLVTVEPVPADHTHDGKKHEGLEIHFQPAVRAAAEASTAGGPATKGPGGFKAQLCYLDPPGICKVC
jgi:hypothetical protein